MKTNLGEDIKISEKPVALSPRDAYTRLHEGTAAILDIRPEYEIDYRILDVPDSYIMPNSSYKEEFQEISKNKFIIIVDNVGLDSPEAAAFLIGKGYLKVGYIIGGVVAWSKAGLPLVKDLGNELTGGCACKLKPKKFTQ